MTRNSAKEAQNGLFSAPFYRMYLRPGKHSTQHESLLALEGTGHAVFYVAPAFHERLELDAAYRKREVWTRSFKIRPLEIGALDDEPHHIAFQYPGGWVRRSAEGNEKSQAATTEEIGRYLLRRLEGVAAGNAAAEVERADAAILKLIHERQNLAVWRGADLLGFERELKPLERLSYFAQRFFDCQLFLVQVK